MKSYKFAYYILLPTTLASSSLVPSFLCSSNWKNFSMETSKRDFWVSLILVLTYTLCALIAFAQGFFEFLYLNYQILKLVSPFKSCYISRKHTYITPTNMNFMILSCGWSFDYKIFCIHNFFSFLEWFSLHMLIIKKRMTF